MIGFLVFTYIRPFEVTEVWQTECIDGAMSNVSKMLGATLGILVAWFVDSKYIKFETAAPWYVQITKVVFWRRRCFRTEIIFQNGFVRAVGRRQHSGFDNRVLPRCHSCRAAFSDDV